MYITKQLAISREMLLPTRVQVQGISANEEARIGQQ